MGHTLFRNMGNSFAQNGLSSGSNLHSVSSSVFNLLDTGPFCRGLPGLIRSMPIPSLSHHIDSFERLNGALGEAKGTPLPVRIADGISAPRLW